LVPLICTVYSAVTLHRLLPQVPYSLWAFVFVGTITLVNLRGIRMASRTNLVLLVIMSVVILTFIIAAIRFLLAREGWHGLLSTQPFYDPQTFHPSAIATGTALAALTYGGFDGVSTLSEDVENPRRNVLLATVFVCVFTGIFGGMQVYLAQRVWPDYLTFPNI